MTPHHYSHVLLLYEYHEVQPTIKRRELHNGVNRRRWKSSRIIWITPTKIVSLHKELFKFQVPKICPLDEDGSAQDRDARNSNESCGSHRNKLLWSQATRSVVDWRSQRDPPSCPYRGHTCYQLLPDEAWVPGEDITSCPLLADIKVLQQVTFLKIYIIFLNFTYLFIGCAGY